MSIMAELCPHLAVLCEQEVDEREMRRIAHFTRESGLPASKTLTSFDFSGAMIPYRSRIKAG